MQMDDQNKLSNFMVKLASLIDEYGVKIFYTIDDDGIHFVCGSKEVAIDCTSDELIQQAMFMSSNIESEAKDIAAKYYSLESLKNQNLK